MFTSSVVLVHCLCVGFSLPSLGLNSYMQEHSKQQTYAKGQRSQTSKEKNSLFTLNKHSILNVGIGNH